MSDTRVFAAAGIAVADLARSVEFYGSVFGMEQTATYSLPNMEEAVMSLGPKQASVVLMQYTDGVERDLAAFAGKLVFFVSDTAALFDRAVAAGCGVVLPITEFGPAKTLVGMVSDPDGYTLELVQVG